MDDETEVKTLNEPTADAMRWTPEAKEPRPRSIPAPGLPSLFGTGGPCGNERCTRCWRAGRT